MPYVRKRGGKKLKNDRLFARPWTTGSLAALLIAKGRASRVLTGLEGGSVLGLPFSLSFFVLVSLSLPYLILFCVSLLFGLSIVLYVLPLCRPTYDTPIYFRRALSHLPIALSFCFLAITISKNLPFLFLFPSSSVPRSFSLDPSLFVPLFLPYFFFVYSPTPLILSYLYIIA